MLTRTRRFLRQTNRSEHNRMEQLLDLLDRCYERIEQEIENPLAEGEEVQRSLATLEDQIQDDLLKTITKVGTGVPMAEPILKRLSNVFGYDELGNEVARLRAECAEAERLAQEAMADLDAPIF